MDIRLMLTTVLASVSGVPAAAQGVAPDAAARGGAAAPTPQTMPAQNAEQGAAVSTTTPAADTQAGLSDIIVTAQRIEENAQRAPVAIDVLKPEELVRQNVSRAEDLARVTPSLVANNAGGANTTFFIRGVGNFTNNAYSDPAIAFNYDGVYIGRPSSTSGSFYDLQRVEVLKGPQGTLYGRNATGGAINVLPNRPRLGETSLDASVGYGNFDYLNAQGAANVPIGDRGAVRLSGNYARRDGIATDGTGDLLEIGARLQLYAELTDALDVRVSSDFAHQGGNGTNATYYARYAYNFQQQQYVYTPSGFDVDQGLHDPRSEAYLSSTFVPQAGRLSEPLNVYPHNNNSYWGALTEVRWRTGAGSLTILPAYREAELKNRFTQAGFRGADTGQRDTQFSLEARWNGSLGRAIDYLVGGYYFDEDVKGTASFNQLTLKPFQNFDTGTSSYAAFGRVAVRPIERLTLTAAGRYTWDRKRFDGLSDIYILFCGNPAPPQDFCPTLPLIPDVATPDALRAFYAARGIRVTSVPLYALPPAAGGSQTAPFVLNSRIPIDARQANEKFTYRLAAQFDVTARNMIYASFETGYRSGGFSFARGLESYAPETIDAYTVGAKNRFLDNRVQLNVEGFYWKYRDQQFSAFGFDLGTPPASVFLTRNIGRSRIRGFDVDLEWLATRTTLLSGNVQYLDSRYERFTFLVPNQGVPPLTGCAYAPATTAAGSAAYSVDCAGKPGFASPRWSINLNAQQTVPLGDHKLVLQGGSRYRSSAYIQQDFNFWGLARAAWVSNASATIGTADDRLFLTAFVNNIENRRRLQFATTNQGAGIVIQNFEAPRSYGIRVGGRF